MSQSLSTTINNNIVKINNNKWQLECRLIGHRCHMTLSHIYSTENVENSYRGKQTATICLWKKFHFVYFPNRLNTYSSIIEKRTLAVITVLHREREFPSVRWHDNDLLESGTSNTFHGSQLPSCTMDTWKITIADHKRGI
jgi:hypothetical protein